MLRQRHSPRQINPPLYRLPTAFGQNHMNNDNNLEENVNSITEGETNAADNDTNIFESSLRELRSSDIKKTFKGKPASIVNSVFIIRMLILVICSSVFLYSAYSIYQKVADGIRTEKLLAGIVENANVKSDVSRITTMKGAQPSLSLYDALGSTDAPETPEIVDPTGEYDSIRFQLLNLKEINKDIYGWIRITGMVADKVEYPVLKGEDNKVYLYRNLYGEYTKSGSIFVDANNSRVHANNYNTIFYGHCMTNGTMFRPIMYWYENPRRNELADTVKIEIITLDGVYEYELFSSYRSEGSHFVTTSFPDNNAYLEFLKTIYAKSQIRRKVSFDENSRIITLSTCTNVAAKPDERYVVHGILTKVIKYSEQ